ncbi:unnamed protein product [Rodentolepis nana]|uniref:V-type proton ATPase subunit a n=1 Tax=Rodentolepis nana TaxID=102285 RepID=A0A0R3TWV8_RODNA|nr:unnamed protein product [Rodentolepis nana]
MIDNTCFTFVFYFTYHLNDVFFFPQAKKIKGDMWDMFFGGRYIILLMGLFSIYTGFIYNDIFSKATNIFGSSWYPLNDPTDGLLNPISHAQNVTGMFAGYPYPFGIDPVWQVSHNLIVYTNSLKMKMSITVGVIHMLFGIILSAFNYKMFKDPLSIYCSLIPEVIFMVSIFGYLVFTIFFKWIVFETPDAPTAPSLLSTLITMMKFGYQGQSESQILYTGQAIVQSILVVLALISVPWMLLAKPIILYRRHKVQSTIGNGSGDYVPFRNESSPSLDRSSGTGKSAQGNNNGGSGHGSGHGDSEEWNFSDIVVHQVIHTIEFCLGCISNTASYLRLWALSLAHAQLSEVLWSMVMSKGLRVDGHLGGVILVFVFGFWAFLTIAVLVIMEGLSAFLHALRLHWVEFQNKFYEGSGYPFEPFTFANIEKVGTEQ